MQHSTETVGEAVLFDTVNYANVRVGRALDFLTRFGDNPTERGKAACVLSNLQHDLIVVASAKRVVDELLDLSEALVNTVCAGDPPYTTRDGTVVRNPTDVRTALDVMSPNGAATVLGNVPAGLPATEAEWTEMVWELGDGIVIRGKIKGERVTEARLYAPTNENGEYTVDVSAVNDLLTLHIGVDPNPAKQREACAAVIAYVDREFIAGAHEPKLVEALAPMVDDAGLDFDVDTINVNDSRTYLALQVAAGRKLAELA